MIELEFVYKLEAKLDKLQHYVNEFKYYLLEPNMDLAEHKLYDLMERYCNEYEICARALRDKLENG